MWSPNRILAIVVISICLFLLSRYIYQHSYLEGFQQHKKHSRHSAPRSRFIFAGYNPLYDLVATQALLKHLDTVQPDISTIQDASSTSLKFRDVPRLYIYRLRSAPDTLHVFISKLRKPQPLIDLVERPATGSPATEAAIKQELDAPLLESMSDEAARFGQMLAKQPPVVLNMAPSSKQREQMRAYFRFFLDRQIQPLADIKLTELDAAYLDLDPILATAPNPEDSDSIPAIHMRDPSRQVFTGLFQEDEPLRVNIVTPNVLTEAKKLAARAAIEDTVSTIRRALFQNPDAPAISPSRVTIFRHKIQTTVNGLMQVVIYFRLADDDMEASQSQLLNQLERLGVAEAVQTTDNPHYPDYVLPRVPVHDYQQVQVLIRSTERGWDAA